MLEEDYNYDYMEIKDLVNLIYYLPRKISSLFYLGHVTGLSI